MDKVAQYRQLLISRDTFACTLLAIAGDLFGGQFFPHIADGEDIEGWDPETLVMELEDALDCRMSQASKNRLLAGFTLAQHPEKFYRSLPDFIDLCNALTDGVFDPTVFDPAEVDEIAWAINEAMILCHLDDDNRNPFSPEIVYYIGEACHRQGLIRAPGALAIGMRDDNPLEKVHDTFSDDPVMFEAIAASENQKTEDIENFVNVRLSTLAEQLLLVPGTTEFAQQLQAAIAQPQ